MASINKLSVRGVRSFSPDDAEQVLEFYFPCTIIVGANGCGKTTIIESLKFAVCGAMPPGNKSGQAFVHDPRSIGQAVVKANVKLRFTGRAGNSMVVVRSMEVQQKKTNMTFKQLDGVLRSTDKDGNRVSMGHKCSELDRQLPLLLGVSKSILEHVVFCHQEDASWPLQEGAVLKKRFDDIFDSTRYSKALEVFAKLKKEYSAKVKDLKADLAGFSSHRHAAKGFRQELSKHNEQMEDLEEQIEADKSTLHEIEEDAKRVQEILEQVDECNNDIEAKKNELTTQRQVIKKQKDMLQEDLTKEHSAREIKNMLHDFDAETGVQVDKKADMETEIATVTSQLERIRRQETELKSRMGRLEAQKEANDKRLRLRYEKMVSIGDAYALGDVLSNISPTQQPQTQSSLYQTNATILDGTMSGNQGDQDPVLDIPQQDMDEFFRAIAKKEDELKETVKQAKERHQQQEDRIQSQISDILGKLSSIKDSRDRLNKQQQEARKELQQVSSEASGFSRTRKSDIEDARRSAAKYAKERDELNNDPRRDQIPTETKALKRKIDELKREIEDDNIVLGDLRRSSEIQHSIDWLKKQCGKELESLETSLRENSFLLQQFNISAPTELAGVEMGDDNGDELRSTMGKLVQDISEKHDSCSLELERTTAESHQLQKAVSEQQALFSHDQQAVNEKRKRMSQLDCVGGSIDVVRGVVTELRSYEKEIGVITPLGISEAKPQELLTYVESRLQDEESQSTEGIPPEIVRKIMNKLKKLVKTDSRFVCPCCEGEFNDESGVVMFNNKVDSFSSDASPLLRFDERNRMARSNYQQWRQTVSARMQDVLEYRRIASEVNELEANIHDLDATLADLMKRLEDTKDATSEKNEEASSLRELLDSAKNWKGESNRIAETRFQMNQKHLELNMSNSDVSGRDMETVEQELADRNEKKDDFQNKINRLNEEMSTLNSRTNKVATQASRLEKIVREKEAYMAKEQKLSERKVELNDVISKCVAEEKKFLEDISPLTQKQSSREAEKKRIRSLNNEEEERLSSTVNSFATAVRELREITNHIEEYFESSADEELANFSNRTAEFNEKAEEKELELKRMKPEFERLAKAVDEHERHKKNLKENLDLIASSQHIDTMTKQLAELEEQRDGVEGRETAYDDDERLTKEKQDMIKSVARLEGRRGEILEGIRSTKRKLAAPEYKNVDEEHRVAMIKHETTQMAVRDLEKYYTALDKALLRFHSIKIAEINTIIRDLWTLTYKGEDITSIQIVSGQDSGSRASRSYNYRVVMTKGSTQLDMRGRCSAGQRVLASIVIRLALAETFCVNFGCIALDEPTVNLDYNNKKGLAIALAQIIASRAQQSNFQLVLITHDEDFVAMMKTELSSQTGFQMPEKYFQVRREEGIDGKFYSKIDAIDWDELV